MIARENYWSVIRHIFNSDNIYSSKESADYDEDQCGDQLLGHQVVHSIKQRNRSLYALHWAFPEKFRAQ